MSFSLLNCFKCVNHSSTYSIFDVKFQCWHRAQNSSLDAWKITLDDLEYLSEGRIINPKLQSTSQMKISSWVMDTGYSNYPYLINSKYFHVGKTHSVPNSLSKNLISFFWEKWKYWADFQTLWGWTSIIMNMQLG